MHTKKRIISNLLLLLTSLIWGTAFVAQSAGMDHISPFTFNASRSLLAGVALLPVVLLLGRHKPAPPPAMRRKTWTGGLWCGVILFLASSFQQFGILHTTVGKVSFITALYIVLVPLFGILLGKRVRAAVWVSVLLGAVGLYLLCMQENLSIERGDLYVLCCAALFAGHILVIDHFTPSANGVMMSMIQFFTAGLLSLAASLLFEAPDMGAILAAWGPILYAGILSGAAGYTLQILGQRHTSPAVASLILSLESVFGALAGWALLGETFTARELLGAAILFAAILLAQLPSKHMQSQTGP